MERFKLPCGPVELWKLTRSLMLDQLKKKQLELAWTLGEKNAMVALSDKHYDNILQGSRGVHPKHTWKRDSEKEI